MLAFLGNLGLYEAMVLAIIAVVVFGGRLPEVARDVMRAVFRARRAFDDMKREMDLGRDLRSIKRDIEQEIDIREEPPATRPRSDAPGESASRPEGEAGSGE